MASYSETEWEVGSNGELVPVEVSAEKVSVLTSTTEGRLAITSELTLERLEIQFVPKELELGAIPNIGEIAIVGRNTPKYQNAGGKVTLKLDLDFYANDEDRQDVIAKCTWLQAMSLNDADKRPAKRVVLHWGDLFRNLYGSAKWVIKAAPAKFSNFNPTKGWLPQQAYVSLDLELDADNNLSHNDLRWDNKNHYGLKW